MPLPLVLAPIAESIVTRLALNNAVNVVGGTTLLGALAGFVGYDYLKDKTVSNPFGSAPTGKNIAPVSLPLKKPEGLASPNQKNPSSSTVSPSAVPLTPSVLNTLSLVLGEYQKSQEREKVKSKETASDLTKAGEALKVKNEALVESVGASKFLLNQVEAKASLDEVGFALNAQSAVLAMIYETLERNLSLMSASMVASLQVGQKANEDMNAQARTNAGALVKIGDRLEPFEDNQIHKRTVAPPIGMESTLSLDQASPRDLAHARDFALARGEADTNSLNGSDLDWVDSLLGNMDITGDMFKPYVRVDTILNHVRSVAEGDMETWESLMEDLYK